MIFLFLGISDSNMSFEQSLVSFIDLYYKNSLDHFQFPLVNKLTQGMGCIFIYQREQLLIRFINDKGQFFVDIGKQGEENTWWQLDWLMACFKIFDEDPIDRYERERILRYMFSWENHEQNAEFFMANIERVQNAFGIKYSETCKQLEILKTERATYVKEDEDDGHTLHLEI